MLRDRMVPSEDMVLDNLESRLGADSLAHSRSTAEMAGLLATIYGLEADKARVTGLLHDWDRDLPPRELISRAFAMGIPIADVEQEVPYLLHAKTGAADVEETFPGIDQEVVSAIRAHTTGSQSMSDLDKIIYIADMIEGLRDFGGIDALREAAGNVSLHDLFALCYAHSLKHLVDSRKKLHPDSVAVWNAQVAGGEVL